MLIPKNPSSVLRALHLEVVYFTFAGVEAEAEAEDPETEKEGERKEARDWKMASHHCCYKIFFLGIWKVGLQQTYKCIFAAAGLTTLLSLSLFH